MHSLKFASLTTLALAFAGFCNTASARFIESDPIGLNGGINTYAYVRGNPMTRVDPFGLADINKFDPIHDPTEFAGGNAWNPAGYFSVAGHGNPTNMWDGDFLYPDRLAKEIRANKNWRGRPVMLGGCNTANRGPTGEASFAQKLADLLGVPVVASSQFVWYDPNGIIGTSPSMTVPPSPNSIPAWVPFFPQNQDVSKFLGIGSAGWQTTNSKALF